MLAHSVLSFRYDTLPLSSRFRRVLAPEATAAALAAVARLSGPAARFQPLFTQWALPSISGLVKS